MTTCTETTGADAPAHLFTSRWLVDGLVARGGVTMLTGERFAGRRRLMGHILTHMLARPAGGPVLWSASDDCPVLRHHGFGRVLYCSGEEDVVEVFGRLNEFARAAGYEPTDEWPITYLDGRELRLGRVDDRQGFAGRFLASSDYDVLVLDPSRGMPGSDFVLLRHLRRWSERYGVSIVFMKPCLEGGKLPATVSARLTLERVSNKIGGGGDCVLRREPSLPALSDLRLVDLGDPLGFRVAA